MDKEKAAKLLISYLQLYNIKYQKDMIEGGQRITVLVGHADNCPNRILEGCVYFFSACMEFKVIPNRQ